MDYKKDKVKRENIILFGFLIEITLYFLSGYLIGKYFILGLIMLLVGMRVAFSVGDKIAKNAIINFKYG